MGVRLRRPGGGLGTERPRVYGLFAWHSICSVIRSEMRRIALITITVAALASPSRAKATTDDAPGPETQSYAYRLVLADAASLGALVVGGTTGNRWVGAAGVAGLFLGAPIVHWTEGRSGTGFASLALRTGLPLLGMGVSFGYLAIRGAGQAQGSPCGGRSSSGSDNCVTGPLLPMMAGAAVGLLGAMVLDYVFLGTKRVPHGSGRVALAPTVSPVNTGAAIGIVGQF
jgi:hypothetical protein